MKKIFITTAFAISIGLFSCGSNVKAESAEEAADIEITANIKQEVPAETYKIENGKIIPVNGKPTIVDFSATWCPPCQKLKPIFAKLEEEFKGRINFVTIDVDENADLSQSYGVQSIPMLLFLDKDGQIQNTLVGFQNRDQLLAAINTYFGF